MTYEAKSVDGKVVCGQLEWDGLSMLIVEDKGYGKSKVMCIPGTERVIDDDR